VRWGGANWLLDQHFRARGAVSWRPRCLLPNNDKQFIVVPGAAHSGLHGKNFRTNLHIMQSYLSQPDPVYLG
jgi:hypothetical protein